MNYTIANNIFYQDYGAGASIDTGVSSPGVITFAYNSTSGTNPQFVNAADPEGPDSVWGTDDDGLRLLLCSPDINAGSNAYVVPGELTDITGAPRIGSISVDMGAYEAHPVGAINGIHDVCMGSTTTLSDTSTTGTWISTHTTIASVGSTGIVHALAVGTDTILFVVTDTCSSDTAFFKLNVIATTNAGNISGVLSLCAGVITTLTDSITDGTWTTSNSRATISSTGILTAATAGIDTLVYTNSCALGHATAIVTVEPVPVVSAISGDTNICLGSYVVFSDTAIAGTWTTYGSNVSSMGDTISGLAAGSAVVGYVKENVWGCMDSATLSVVVVATPLPGYLSGTNPTCVGSVFGWFDSHPDGIWSLSNDSIATIVSSTGVVTAVAAGTDTIKYTVSNVCGTNTDHVILTVSRTASAITGTDTFCTGSTVLLSDSTVGGAWSSAYPSAATVNDTGLVLGIQQGAVAIEYTVSNVCGTSDAPYVVYVELPATAIAGIDTLCQGQSTIFSDSTFSGIWTSSDTGVAVIDSFLGAVFAVTPGNATITYTVNNSCGITYATENIRVLTASLCDSISRVSTVNEQGDIKIFPNPTSISLTVVSTSTINQITISDLLGQTVYYQSYNSPQVQVDISDLPNGVYLIKVNDSVMRKFVKD